MENYYEILKISKTASSEEIKQAYLNEIKIYHPDVFDGDKEFAQMQTAKITEAYTTLKDYLKRKNYDEKMFGKTQESHQHNNQTVHNQNTNEHFEASKNASSNKTNFKSNSAKVKTKKEPKGKKLYLLKVKIKEFFAKLKDIRKQFKEQLVLDVFIIVFIIALIVTIIMMATL